MWLWHLLAGSWTSDSKDSSPFSLILLSKLGSSWDTLPILPGPLSDLSAVLVPLDRSLLLVQLAGEIGIFKLSHGLVFELCREIGRGFADHQVCCASVFSNHRSVLAFVIHHTVLDGQRVFESISSVDDAFTECHFLASLHPPHRHLGPIHLTNEADGFLLLRFYVLDGLQESVLLLCREQRSLDVPGRQVCCFYYTVTLC